MKKGIYVGLILSFELGLGNQPIADFSISKPSVFIADIRKEMLNPIAITSTKYYFFNNSEIPNLLANDSIQIQKPQSDASRVTFEKIALESVSGISISLAIAGIWRKILYPNSTQPWWASNGFYDPQYLIGFSIGAAIGVSVPGHILMKPDGSILKSLSYSALCTGLGACIASLTMLSYGWEPSENNNLEIFFIGQSIALLLPITGAVYGYNQKKHTCCCLTAQYYDFNENPYKTYNIPCLSYKIQIISIKF